MERQSLNGKWQMRRVGDPVFSEAIVPGSVYTDLLRNGQMEDPFFKDNELKALKLMDEDYEYLTSFDCAKSVYHSDRKVLHFDGIDTIADVYLNGEMIGSPDNMHRTWEYDVTEEVKEEGNELRIVFHSPNKYIAEAFQISKTHGSEDAMDGFVNIRKAHCMFGWDWGERTVLYGESDGTGWYAGACHRQSGAACDRESAAVVAERLWQTGSVYGRSDALF